MFKLLKFLFQSESTSNWRTEEMIDFRCDKRQLNLQKIIDHPRQKMGSSVKPEPSLLIFFGWRGRAHWASKSLRQWNLPVHAVGYWNVHPRGRFAYAQFQLVSFSVTPSSRLLRRHRRCGRLVAVIGRSAAGCSDLMAVVNVGLPDH